MTELRQRMIADLRIRNYSPRTIDCYTRCVAAFARYCGQSPAELGPEQIRAYQTHLVETKHGSWTAFNQAVCALRFLYGTTLQRPGLIQDLPFPRQPKRLMRHRPEVADVVAQAGAAYRARYGASRAQQRILRDLVRCRTAALGGHTQ